MTDLQFAQAVIAAKNTFVNSWNALKVEERTDENFQILAQQERDAIDDAHTAYASPTNPPGHPIRPH